MDENFPIYLINPEEENLIKWIPFMYPVAFVLCHRI